MLLRTGYRRKTRPAWCRTGRDVPTLREELGQVGLEGGLRLGADDRLDDLAAPVDLHRGDRGDLVLRRRLGVVVDVELDDRDLVGVLVRDLVEDRADRATRAAPLRPEVDEDRLLGVRGPRSRTWRPSLERAADIFRDFSCDGGVWLTLRDRRLGRDGGPAGRREGSARYCSASSAATVPDAAAVTACRYVGSITSPAAKTPGRLSWSCGRRP